MANVFVWYSKGSRQTGSWLAEKLNAEHGTLPPKDFQGLAICWGAVPSSKFKWENRDFQEIFNDPREVRSLLDRKKLFDVLNEKGVPTISCTSLVEGANYGNIRNLLAVGAEGFVAAKINGAKARRVTCQAELDEAIEDGCNRAFEPAFANPERWRMFCVDGQVVGSAAKSSKVSERFADDAAKAATEDWGDVNENQVRAVIQRVINKGILKPGKSFWKPSGAPPARVHNLALQAAEKVDMEFAAVDIVNGKIVNVVTTPNLREISALQKPIVNAIKEWIDNNSKSAKEVLLGIINECNDEEASALLEELSELKENAA